MSSKLFKLYYSLPVTDSTWFALYYLPRLILLSSKLIPLVWHMTTKAGLAHSIIKSFRPEDQIIIAVYAFLGRERT